MGDRWHCIAVVAAVLRKYLKDENKVQKAAGEVVDEIVDKFSDNYRSLEQIEDIVACVREGLPVQVAYYDPEIDEDPMTVRQCW